MSDLKPCPFCGGEAELTCFEAPEFWVWCPNCKASTDAHTCKGGAIEAWNTRAERTCKVAACYDTADVDSRGSNAEWYFAFTCGDELYWDEPEPPSHCPCCGARVIA